tara:strand:- start:1019 stop:2089 length:1071 start_codon:yes stop_codon:yes gene_type:complete
MPIPKPRPRENNNRFINRCMSDSTMVVEYPDSEQRYAVCSSQIKKNYLTNKQRKIISRNFVKNVVASEKKNYSIAYKFYIEQYKKGIKMFQEEPSASNANLNSLFTETLVNTMFVDIWSSTGFKFYFWYKNYFGDKKKNMTIKEITQSFYNEGNATPPEPFKPDAVHVATARNLASTINQNIRNYVLGRENYLALAGKITGVSGVATETLKKVLSKYIYDTNFMSLGEAAKVRVLEKELKFKARWMAKRIVRTETTAAANFGISLSAKDAFGSDGYVKGWVATDDGRTRSTHTRAWRQYRKTPIPVDNLFIVGGSLLKFPGDSSQGAVAAETVNCRCVSIPFNKELFNIPGDGLNR